MPSTSYAGLFETDGSTWAQRATLGELDAVLSPGGRSRRNEFLHFAHVFGARVAAREGRKRCAAVLVDFGCGTGRFTRWFAARGYSIVGTEITPEMQSALRQLGQPPHVLLLLTDGVRLPIRSESVDIIWFCAVLRYARRASSEAYEAIARDAYRALRPGGIAVNLEMYVHEPPERYTSGFESAGFRTIRTSVLVRHVGWPERLIQFRYFPSALVSSMAQILAGLRYLLDRPSRRVEGLRDYLLIWEKPARRAPEES